MVIDKKSSVHICNVIRRQIQARFPDFTPFVILFEGDGLQASVERESRQILKHPAGQKILDYLRRPDSKNAKETRTRFVALADYHRNSAFGFFDRHSTLGVFFVNTQQFENEFTFRSQILHMIWHALAIREDYLRKVHKTPKLGAKPNFFEEETYELQDGIVRPKLLPDMAYQRNLMADIFSAGVQYLQGDMKAIRSLATLRMRETLSAKDGFIGERYPFAVSHDTLEFMFDNHKLIRNRRGVVSQAYKIAQDIGENYTIPSTEQWKNFSHPAQHMAWIGYTPESILGAAIYTSENPFVRAIGDMVADYTKIEPEIVTSIEDFNPLVGKTKALKAHKKSCFDCFRKIILDVSVSSDLRFFHEEARKQTQKLQVGNPYGWCAHALIKLAGIYREEFAGRYDLSQKARIEELFEDAQKEIPYETLLKFSVLVFQKRRLGLKMSIDDLVKLARLNAEFELIGNAIEKSSLDVFQSTVNL